MTEKKNSKVIKTTGVIVSVCMLVLAIAGLVWAAATQNERLETVVEDSAETEVKAQNNKEAIIVITTKMDYIVQTVTEIKEEVKK